MKGRVCAVPVFVTFRRISKKIRWSVVFPELAIADVPLYQGPANFPYQDIWLTPDHQVHKQNVS